MTDNVSGPTWDDTVLSAGLWRPLAICCHYRLVSVVDALKSLGPEQSTFLDLEQALSIAVIEGHEDIVQVLIDMRARLDLRRLNMDTLVYSAVASAQTKILIVLLEHGTEPDGAGGQEIVSNPVALLGNEDQVRALLEYKASTKTTSKLWGHPLLAVVC